MSADFVAHMEDVLDLYAEPYDPHRPVVCFDETSTQLLADARPPLPVQPGRPARQDYEYRREGTRNLFLACEPLAGWRQVAVTERRTMRDFAQQIRWLVDETYPEARRIARRLEFHYTPKHGSWLNPVLSLPKGWRKSSSASCPAVASGRGSPTRKPSAGKCMPWSGSETKPEPSLTGALVFGRPGRNSTDSTPSIPSMTDY